MTVEEIGRNLCLTIKPKVVDELLELGLWERDPAGSLVVSRFQEQTTPADPTAADRVKRYRDRTRERNALRVTDTVTVTAEETVTEPVTKPLPNRNGNGESKREREEREIPPDPSGSGPPPKTRRVAPALEPPPAFDEPLESEVVAIVALMAAANKDGKISESRVATERRTIGELVTAHGESAVLYGLREAVRHGKASVEYARTCAKGYNPGNPRHVAIAGQTKKRFEGENTARKWDDETLIRGGA